MQNFALVVAALALRPDSAATAAATLLLATAASAAFTGALAVRHLPGRAAAGVSAGALAWRLGVAGGLAQLQQRGAVPVAAALGVSGVETGCAAVAVGAAVALITAVVQVFLIELPVAARRVAAGHGAAVRDRGTQLALGAVAAGGAIALAGVVAGPPLIDAVLGDDFASAGDALAPALAAVPLAPIAALGRQSGAARGASDDACAAGGGRSRGVRPGRDPAALDRQRRVGRGAGDAGGCRRRQRGRGALRASAGAAASSPRPWLRPSCGRSARWWPRRAAGGLAVHVRQLHVRAAPRRWGRCPRVATVPFAIGSTPGPGTASIQASPETWLADRPVAPPGPPGRRTTP